ncbi:hypothetical protein C791_4235 [Amycolatopsis azurea DSM 43854]|uniref:Uncharacterized protein n=1 Tax=Amycolatopsis azurea DSM 43854 TaxID=1238180 RepID=M2QRY6_9PSEU|nr:hypothetical protein C791_4235 [Amycolatopsis azurea DSM 43854]
MHEEPHSLRPRKPPLSILGHRSADVAVWGHRPLCEPVHNL